MRTPEGGSCRRYAAGFIISVERGPETETAARHACSRVNMMAIKLGPMNKPRKPNAMKPPKTPRIVSDIGISTPKPISQGLTKLSATLTTTPQGNHKYAPGLMVLRKQPPSRSAPHQHKQGAADLADREQQRDEAEHSRRRHASQGQADRQQDCLDRCGADYAIGNTTYRARRNIERLLRN